MTADESYPAPSSSVAEPGPGAGFDTVSHSRVELVLDSHRISAELRYSGPPRRLVDVLNAMDGPYFPLYAAQIEDLFGAEQAPERFELIHITRDAVLFAVPRDDYRPSGSSELVRKVPVSALLLLPGFSVRGNIHLVPDLEPRSVSMLGHRHFIPMTEVAVVSSRRDGPTWHEPLLLVNLARAQLYGPQPQAR
ncbi:MAG TPA: hypothetical protein VFT91_06715 [Dehalococcoidia bacterium]|nr:hypothetical protein [Dehalococcoidia bacterium]